MRLRISRYCLRSTWRIAGNCCAASCDASSGEDRSARTSLKSREKYLSGNGRGLQCADGSSIRRRSGDLLLAGVRLAGLQKLLISERRLGGARNPGKVRDSVEASFPHLALQLIVGCDPPHGLCKFAGIAVFYDDA